MRRLADLIRLVQILAVFGIGQNQLGYVLASVPQRNVKDIVAVLFDNSTEKNISSILNFGVYEYIQITLSVGDTLLPLFRSSLTIFENFRFTATNSIVSPSSKKQRILVLIICIFLYNFKILI